MIHLALGLALLASTPNPGDPVLDESVRARIVAAIEAPAPAHPAPKAAARAAGPWEELMRGNRRFVRGQPQPRNHVKRRRELAAGQHPAVAVLTCADSRVGPEILFDQGLGDLFVVRTAGNVADAIALGSLEYAVEHLHVRLLVVLGHEECGAVAAAAAGGDPGSPNLQAIVQKISPAISKLSVCGSGGEIRRERVEANVLQSASELEANSAIIREHLADGRLSMVTAVYALGSGEVTRIGSH